MSPNGRLHTFFGGFKLAGDIWSLFLWAWYPLHVRLLLKSSGGVANAVVRTFSADDEQVLAWIRHIMRTERKLGDVMTISAQKDQRKTPFLGLGSWIRGSALDLSQEGLSLTC